LWALLFGKSRREGRDKARLELGRVLPNVRGETFPFPGQVRTFISQWHGMPLTLAQVAAPLFHIPLAEYDGANNKM